MRSYFDGSEGVDDSSSRWLTLAGFVAPDKCWARFYAQWEQMLRDRYPVAPYVHMYELLGRDDPFERKAGWTNEKITQLVVDAIEVLAGTVPRSFHSIVCSIDVSAHDRLQREGMDLLSPHTICTKWCVRRVVEWIHPSRAEMIYLFFDRNESFAGPLKDQWLKNRTPLNRVANNPNWDIIADIQELDMQRHPPLQAADMLAWGKTRSLRDVKRPFRNLLEAIHSYVPSKTIDIGEQMLRDHSD